MGIYRLFTALFLIVLTSSNAFGQSPEPPKETSKLYKFEGYWMGNAKIEAGGEKETVPYHFEFAKVLGGWGLSYREYVNSKIFGNYIGLGYLGYDPHDGLYHWHTLSNAGDSHDHIGTWLDDNTFVLERTGFNAKEIYNEKLRCRFTSASEVVFDFELYINKESIVKMTGTFKKSPGVFPAVSTK